LPVDFYTRFVKRGERPPPPPLPPPPPSHVVVVLISFFLLVSSNVEPRYALCRCPAAAKTKS
jgi:hypothetical protein